MIKEIVRPREYNKMVLAVRHGHDGTAKRGGSKTGSGKVVRLYIGEIARAVGGGPVRMPSARRLYRPAERPSIGVRISEGDQDGLQDDLQIETQRPVAEVFQVVADA